jgi:Cu/Ag efflux protein CusF
MVRPFLPPFLLAFALTVACSPKRTETSGPEKHYELSGEILSLDAKNQSANINAAAIPNYMDAMAMDYPVKSAAEFSSLHVGDKIKATLNVSASGAEYNVSNIQKQSSGSK